MSRSPYSPDDYRHALPRTGGVPSTNPVSMPSETDVLRADNARLRTANEALVKALEGMLATNPVFRSKPIGAPGSVARAEQDAAIAAEDYARSVLFSGGNHG